jgi:anion-transporting  ArsA/GET3 family ATPase
LKIIIHQNFKKQEEAIAQLVNSFFKNKRLLVKGSRNMIKTSLLGEDDVNIKLFKKPGFIKSIIYSFFLATKAKRSYEYANYLLENNIKTPFPIAYAEKRNSLGLLSYSFYVSEQIHYDFTFRELIHNPLFPDRIEILEQFTEFTFQMHEARINFLDHSPGNTLIIKKTNGNYDFFLVDLNRMKFENLSIEQRMENFKRLWLSKTMIEVIALKYAQLSNEPFEKLIKILKEKSSSFKKRTARKKYFKKYIGKK